MSGIRVTIAASALPAWQRLQAALRAAKTVPCADRDEWTSADPEVREWAAWHCAGCDVIAECAAFASANRETAGVWGGVDRTGRVGRPTTVGKESPNECPNRMDRPT